MSARESLDAHEAVEACEAVCDMAWREFFALHRALPATLRRPLRVAFYDSPLDKPRGIERWTRAMDRVKAYARQRVQPRWTVGAGRAILYNGAEQVSVMRDVDMSMMTPVQADRLVARIVKLLNEN